MSFKFYLCICVDEILLELMWFDFSNDSQKVQLNSRNSINFNTFEIFFLDVSENKMCILNFFSS